MALGGCSMSNIMTNLEAVELLVSDLSLLLQMQTDSRTREFNNWGSRMKDAMLTYFKGVPFQKL